jgi:Spx/MgsR family transcriptional regulator
MMLYGIKNCDTIKKARRYLEQAGVDYQFHDYRQDGLDPTLLAEFAAKLGWQQLLNTRGTTWRALSKADKTDLNEQKALSLMLAQPALIKRPVLVNAEHYLLGFTEQSYQTFIKQS